MKTNNNGIPTRDKCYYGIYNRSSWIYCLLFERVYVNVVETRASLTRKSLEFHYLQRRAAQHALGQGDLAVVSYDI